jgi:SecD/SecF fusion protein
LASSSWASISKAGVILVYEVNELETKQLRRGTRENEWDMGQLLAVITRRLNPTGLKEIVVRPFGPKQVEIVVPEVDPAEIEKIKETIRTGGVLQFMIVASDERDTELYDTARQQAEKESEDRLRRDVVDADGTQVGYWARLGREKGENSPFRAFETVPTSFLRDSRTGEVIELSPQERQLFANSPSAFDAYLKQRGIPNIDVLMVFDQDFSIRGDDLAVAYAGHDESFRPAIHFTMRTDGSIKMGHVTQENLHRKLAIIFDNELLSAPVIQSKISDNGQITGNFTQEEVDFIVGILKSGSMPVVMQKNPISENQIGSILGRETIQQGSRSVLVAMALVFLFMVAYYRFSGVVASFALALNLALTVAIMVALQAPFTLPGLAGLVLTLAMSVDANVLISERMREEIARGATLRMAIRNGFDKALSAILDGNLTTFLTAFVLYFIGTDQVKGFGMTLMLGNITSMYTAIFCARVILDVGERTRWLKKLSMTSFLTNPRIDWVRFFGPAVAGSAILVLIGAVATVARGKGLFDIDLAGGTSVIFLLKEPQPEDQVRAKLDAVFQHMTDPETKSRVDHNVYEMASETQPANTVYKVDSSLHDIDLLKSKVREALRTPDGKDLLKTYSVEVGSLEEVPQESPPISPSLSAPSAVPSATPSDAQPSGKSKVDESPAPKGDAQPSAPNGSGGCGDMEEIQETTKSEQAESKKASEDTPPPPAEKSTAAEPSTPPAAEQPLASQPAPRSKLKTTTTLKFPGSPISAGSLRARIQASAKVAINQDLTDIGLDNPSWDRLDNSTFEEWKVTVPVGEDQARLVLGQLQKDLGDSIIWQTSSQIGGQVSADTQLRALGALAVSLLGIVAYVWFRFQKVAWGLAAVAALAHDALVMLTAIALSYWVVGPLGILGVEEFKISLPVVAAFLAVLGYSVNDTIVIFDRLREIRGKNPNITRQMLNDAVNQTLSRNIILAGITLTVVTILYGFGGPGIHAFAFALLIGVISGCYTTLVIAAPLLLWLLNRQAALTSRDVEKREATKSVA